MSEATMIRTFVPIIAASLLVAGCHARGEEGGGATVSKNYSIGNFQQIEVAGPYDVEVRTGANPSVSGTGGERLLERTVVEVEGDKLVIHPENNHGFFHWGWSRHGKAHFTVTVPQLSGATIAGSGGIKVDKITGNAFAGEIAGSGGLELASVEVQSLKLSIGGSGDVKARAGHAKTADYEIAGSGGIDAGGIAAEQAKVSIAGSGSVRANATATADVDVMGSGDVNVTGGAKCNISKAGSGDVHCS
jgi:hypothetical protein